MERPNTRSRNVGLLCPHCNARAIARSSAQVTSTCRTIYYRCDNDECGHTFIAQLAILHSTVPSRIPNPQVNLPLRVAATLKHLAEVQDFPANDPAISGLLDQLDSISR
jgi:predicted RNA-binding Zn-ribbon protein involved in translation (DUF1610 family)